MCGSLMREGCGKKFDYFDLEKQLCAWLKIQHFDQVIFYNSKSPQEDSAVNYFYEKLQRKGWTVRLFPLAEKRNKMGERYYVQKGVDVALCIDMCFKGEYKACVVSSGDRDFVPAIKEVKTMWKDVYLCGYKHSMAHEMRMEAKDVMFL